MATQALAVGESTSTKKPQSPANTENHQKNYLRAGTRGSAIDNGGRRRICRAEGYAKYRSAARTNEPTSVNTTSTSPCNPANAETAAAPAIAGGQGKRSSRGRIEANRRNAKHSTGPRTPRGNRTVSRNAIKHGLLAREVVISGEEGREKQQDFDNLISQLCEYYNPIGAMEEMLVEKIATMWLLLNRTDRPLEREHVDQLTAKGQLENKKDLLANISDRLAAIAYLRPRFLRFAVVRVKLGVPEHRELDRRVYNPYFPTKHQTDCTATCRCVQQKFASDGAVQSNFCQVHRNVKVVSVS